MFKKYRVVTGIAIFLSLYTGALCAFATTYVAPGTVLDPAGLPGGYTVGPFLSYGGAVTTGHDNEVLYMDGSGNLVSDSNFVRDASTGETLISQDQSGITAGVGMSQTLFGGLPAVSFIRQDSNGSAVAGLFDTTSLGGSAYTFYVHTQDSIVNSQAQLFTLPHSIGGGVANATGEQGSFNIQDDSAALRVDNQNGGNNDVVQLGVDLGTGLGTQYAYLEFRDVAKRYLARFGSNGLTLDFDNGASTPGLFYSFPVTDGTSGQVLATDGSGQISWVSTSATIQGYTSAIPALLNTALGVNTADVGVGYSNTWIGAGAGSSMTVNNSAPYSRNTFVGAFAGSNITTGTSNVLVGYQSAFSTTNADYNVQIGTDTELFDGAQNTVSIGQSVKAGGITNILIGYAAGSGGIDSSSARNIGMGYSALSALTTGSDNVALGTDAGVGVTTGSDNILIGKNATATGDGSIVIGNNLSAPTDKLVLIGGLFEGGYDPAGLNGVYAFLGDRYNAGHGTVLSVDDKNQKIRFYFGANSYTFPSADGTMNYLLATDGSGNLFWQDPTLVPSDRTLKTDVESLQYGLSTIMNLNPVSYTLTANNKRQIGFIAQDVEPIVPELVGEVADGKKGLAYGQLTAVIVKAIQELNMKVENIQPLSSEPSSLIDQFTSAILHIRGLVVGSSEYRTGITLYDEVTGEPYCLSVADGQPKSVAGECGSGVSSSGSTSNSTNSDTSIDDQGVSGSTPADDATTSSDTSLDSTTTVVDASNSSSNGSTSEDSTTQGETADSSTGTE